MARWSRQPQIRFLRTSFVSHQLSRRTLLRPLWRGSPRPGLRSCSPRAAPANTASSPGASGHPVPDNPVKWPLSTKNPPIESGLKPEPGSTLRLYNYSDYLGPGVLKAFEKEFDVDISVSTFNDTDEALNKVASGDLGSTSTSRATTVGRLVHADLLRPLNHDYIPNIDNLWPEFYEPLVRPGLAVLGALHGLHDRHRVAHRHGLEDIAAARQPVRRVLGPAVQGQPRRDRRLPHRHGHGAAA